MKKLRNGIFLKKEKKEKLAKFNFRNEIFQKKIIKKQYLAKFNFREKILKCKTKFFDVLQENVQIILDICRFEVEAEYLEYQILIPGTLSI